MSSREVVRFGAETWAKGDRGRLGAHASDQGVIQNFRLWDDGALGMRPLWDIEFDLGASFGIDALVVPCRYDYGFNPDPAAEGFLVVDDDQWEFYEWGTATAYAEYNSVLTFNGDRYSSVTQIDALHWLIDEFYVTMQGAAPATPKVFGVADVGAAIDTAFGGGSTFQCEGSTIHQGRAFYFGQMFSGTTYAAGNRIYYSDDVSLLGYNTFSSASQFFDVNGTVRGCASVGANLFIWTEEGYWYMLQGRGDPSLGTLNSLGKARIPARRRWPAILDRKAIFLSSDGEAIVTVSEGGKIDDETLGYLGSTTGPSSYTAVAPSSPASSSLSNSIIVPLSDTTAYHFYNGAWVRESWDNEASVGDDFIHVGIDDINGQETLAVWRGGFIGDWRIYRRPISVDGPSTTAGGTFAEYDEEEANYVGLPRIFNSTNQVRIVKLTLDVRAWGDGTFYPQAVASIRVTDGKGVTTTLVQGPESSLMADVGAVNGESHRLNAYPDSALPFTHFSDITFVASRGIAIEAITVEFEVSKGPVQ